MHTLWELECEIPKRERLKGHLQADAVIVGGGMAGILTAHFLQKKGLHVIVLEADRIGSGQTCRTTAKVTMQHDYIFHTLLQKYGQMTAAGYAKANERAIWDYKKLIRAKNINCDFEEKDAWIYTITNPRKLEKEIRAMDILRIHGDYLTNTDLPFSVTSAIRMRKQGQFHPLKFLKAVAEGLEIYEQSKVLSVGEGKAITREGSVRADHVVIAAHYPFTITPGYYFMRLHQERSYVLALQQSDKPSGMYLGIDKEGYSFRSHGDTLLLGGAGHRTGAHKEVPSFQKLERAARQWYPESKEVCRWAAQDCMPASKLPYIGDFSNKWSNVYTMTGFQKWGMTNAMAGARIVSEKILGCDPVYEDVFSPQKLRISSSAAKIGINGAHYTAGVIRQCIFVPEKKMRHIRKGTGGIVSWQGQKLGVYKKENGEVFTVSIKCPHLGCMLSWNQEELSWDCPCHGSRFDYKGSIIDNPTLRRLRYEKK